MVEAAYTNSDFTFESTLDMSLTEFGLRKVFSVCLDAVVMEEAKFINAVEAYEQLLEEDLESQYVKVRKVDKAGDVVFKKDEKTGKLFVERVEMPYEQYLTLVESLAAAKFPNSNDLRQVQLRRMQVAFAKFGVLSRIVRHKEPVRVMYSVKPGRADLIGVVRLREYAKKIAEGTATGADAAAALYQLADELKQELFEASQEKPSDDELEEIVNEKKAV